MKTIIQNYLEKDNLQPAPSQYGSPELQAMIVARAIEKDRAAQPAQEPNNFCPRCGKRLQGVLGQPQMHTCTPPLWGHT